MPLKPTIAILVSLIALTPRAQVPVPAPDVTPPQRPAGTGGALEQLLPAAAGPRVIVIDPGHGGDDAGVRGGGRVLEKQVALETARRLRGVVESRLGARVILTRDDDTTTPFEARAAAANTNRAQLFVSLHFNAAPSSDATGALVYSLRLGREGEQSRRDADRLTGIAIAGGGSRTVELVPWTFAQSRHLEQSARLASAVAAGLAANPSLRTVTPLQAPLRVLTEIDAPAILVEFAYLTNAAQAKLAASEEFQSDAAEALFTGLARFVQQETKK